MANVRPHKRRTKGGKSVSVRAHTRGGGTGGLKHSPAKGPGWTRVRPLQELHAQARINAFLGNHPSCKIGPCKSGSCKVGKACKT